MVDFTAEEKIEAFEKIANLYFCGNFGSTSKADIELLLFSEYLEHYLNSNTSDNDFSDYNLSRKLGITQSRIRALKERKQLKYPHPFNWRESFAACLETATYENGKLKVYIEDVNVQHEIRHFLAQKGQFDDYSLNRRLCVFPIDSVIDIFEYDLAKELSDEAKDKLYNYVKTEHKNDNALKKFLQDFNGNGLKNLLKTAGTSIVCESLAAFASKGIISSITKALTNGINI